MTLSYCCVNPPFACGADMCLDETVAADALAIDFGGSDTLRETGAAGSSLTIGGVVDPGRGLMMALDRARFARKRGSSVLSLKNSSRS